MDTSQIGKIAANFMDQLEKQKLEYEKEGCVDFSVGEIVLVSEIHFVDEDGDQQVTVSTASTSPNRIHQTGIVSWGLALIQDMGIPAVDDDED